MQNPGGVIKQSTYELIEKMLQFNFMNALREVIRSGNYKLASYTIGDKWKQDMFYLNQLHYEVLTVKEAKDLFKFHRNSTNKNCV